MLAKGNTKLGTTIYSFNLPALDTCPGKSAVCIILCYATKRRFKSGLVRAAHSRNLDEAQAAGFFEEMIAEIKSKKPKTVRIHAAGDFFNVRYIKAWIKVIRAFPHITFYAYTRSWIIPQLLTHLKVMAALPNFDMWFSCDRAMGCPPRIKGIRSCYLAENDEDKPRFKVNLVFRDKRNTKIKKYGRYNSQVCPVEQGISRQVKITCDSCGICFDNAKEYTNAKLVQ
jgi:ribosomal protein S12